MLSLFTVVIHLPSQSASTFFSNTRRFQFPLDGFSVYYKYVPEILIPASSTFSEVE